jgi:malyl-CoA/(S)-citramalyl-CoA lyase
VIFLDRLLTMIERTLSRTQPLGIEVLIETTRGLADVDAIAAASGRLRAMIFGVGDYSIDLQNFETVFGAASPDYAVLAREAGSAPTRHWNDQWHFALAKIANACRANNIRPIDGPYTDYGDTEGYRAACRRSRALGFEGKWAIHPSQVALANEQFSPQPHQIAWARKIVEQMEAADSEGRGAIGMGGVLFDRAHVKLAQKILNRASQLDATVSRSS